MSDPKKILYVDDEFINLELFRVHFKNNFLVYTAASGIEALKILESESIDVIITDLKMPGMSGIELIENIKKKSPQKVCMILSAYLDNATFHEYKNTLAFKLISKPWKKPELEQAIIEAFTLAESNTRS
ncbi:MAG TPA: response regulator [Salinivirgaceae bacterium]|nr:response regulator [Salinivirgaceae bacterium]